MMWARRFWLRLQALFLRNRSAQQLNDEIEFHLDQQIAENLAAGVNPQEARYAAMQTFGNPTLLKEETRDTWGWIWLEQIGQDIRYGLRTLRKSPNFTAVAVLTLALGIGANTAIFSLLDALVLRDLSVPHPEQLVRFGVHAPDESYFHLSLSMFKEFSRQQKVFSATFGSWGDAVLNVDMNGAFSQADVVAVTGNYYAELGATPEIGRLIGPEDVNLDSMAPAQVAVLDYGFWQRHYGGAKDVIGKTIKIEDVPFTIIGVIRRGFKGLSAEASPEVIIPLTAKSLIIPGSGQIWVGAMGRLKPDITLQQAQAQLETLWPGIQKAQTPENGTPGELARYRSLRVKAESREKGGSFVREHFAKPLYVLFGIAGAVLLLACANLASLMLARAASRSHEMAVRAALGAGHARIARQMLTESVMLSVAGTVAGWGLAHWASRAISGLILGEIYIIPAELNLAPDWRILGFTAGAAIFTGVLFGLAPAWRATQEGPNAALRHGSRTLGSGTGRLGKGLIVAQVALSVVLLAGAGLFVRTLEKLHAADPGFRTHSLLDVDLFQRTKGNNVKLDWASYYHQLTDQVAVLPGVESAGIMHPSLGNILEWTQNVRIAGTNTEGFTADFAMLMPGALRTLGITVLSGRSFNWQDDSQKQHVAVVSKSFAEKLFPSDNAIGQRLEIVSNPKWQNVEIVGIVSNASLYDVRKGYPSTIYVPTVQYPDYMGGGQLMVQTSMPPAAIAGALRQAVESFGHEYISSIKTVRQNIDRSILQERVTAMLSAFFGALALLIAAIGLYGLMAHAVTQRTREIGIRMAMGAERAGVLKMVVRETLSLVGAGVGIGLPCALATTRLISHMLYGVSPNDPVTLACVLGALLAVGTLAGYLPARRAMRVDPMVALRYE